MFVQDRFLRVSACGRLALFAGIALLFMAQPGLAGHSGDVNGTPSTYNVTVSEFSLCADSNCASKTAIISSSSTFNIAGATSGASAGDYVPAGTSVPSGTYSHFLVKISQTLRVVGRISTVVHSPDRDCITENVVATSDSGAHATGLTLQNTGTGSPGTTTFTIPAANGALGGGGSVSTVGGIITLIVPFSAPITVTDGEAIPSFEINFDVANGIGGYNSSATNCAIYLNDLKITVKVAGVLVATIIFSRPA